MKTIFFRYAALAFITVITFASCVKTGAEKKKELNGTYEVAIEGSLNDNIEIKGACTNLFANYMDFTNLGLPNTKALVIEGKDDKGELIGITVYFNELPSDGKFSLGLDQNLEGYWGMAQFNTDWMNTNEHTIYTTDEINTGTCTIIYDQVNQTVSGTFEFAAQGMGFPSGATLAGVHASFHGSFSDVPINDITDPNNPKGPCFGTQGNSIGQGGSNGNNEDNETSTVTFNNAAFTPIEINFNGETKEAPVGGKAVFSGTPNSHATGDATTSGKTNTGTIIGLTLTWNLDANFPQKGANTNETLNIASNYFFLKMQNKSSMPINKVYVNYNLIAQTTDNITISNDGNLYGLGYYEAYSNSNVRAENGNLYWYWSSLSLPFTNNQSITLQAN